MRPPRPRGSSHPCCRQGLSALHRPRAVPLSRLDRGSSAQLSCACPSQLLRRRGPVAPLFDLDLEGRPLRQLLTLPRIPIEQETHRALELGATVDDPRSAVDADPPQAVPILVVRVDEEADPGLYLDVEETLQPAMALGLLVDHEPHRVAVEGV